MILVVEARSAGQPVKEGDCELSGQWHDRVFSTHRAYWYAPSGGLVLIAAMEAAAATAPHAGGVAGLVMWRRGRFLAFHIAVARMTLVETVDNPRFVHVSRVRLNQSLF